jgi:hypothetical protein
MVRVLKFTSANSLAKYTVSCVRIEMFMDPVSRILHSEAHAELAIHMYLFCVLRR